MFHAPEQTTADVPIIVTNYAEHCATLAPRDETHQLTLDADAAAGNAQLAKELVRLRRANEPPPPVDPADALTVEGAEQAMTELVLAMMGGHASWPRAPRPPRAAIGVARQAET